MKTLPLKSIWPEDEAEVGSEIANLAYIHHQKIPVLEGIVAFPPIEEFSRRYKQPFNADNILETIDNLRRVLLKISHPVELKELLLPKGVEASQVWQELLSKWLHQLQKDAYRSASLNLESLKPEYVLLSNQITASGTAYYDPQKKDTVINIDTGQIAPEHLQVLDQYIYQLKSHFPITQVFSWVLDKEIKLTRVAPWTGRKEPAVESRKVPASNRQPRLTATKIFQIMGDQLTTAPGLEGVIIQSEQISDFDKRRYLLSEIASSFPNLPVIYRLADFIEDFGGSRGVFRLIHDQSLLEKEAQVFLFARNKMGLNNVSIGLPITRSVEELKELKRNLSAIGITRKGSLKIWLELGVPENLLNIEEYLIAGIDGVLLNLDQLAAWVNGYNPQVQESVIFLRNYQSLITFLRNFLKTLHRANTPIIAFGQLIHQDEMLDFLIKAGVFGLGLDQLNSLDFRETVFRAEQRQLKLNLA